MKLIGVRTPGTDDTLIALSEGDDKARVLATLQDFWADPARWLAVEPIDGQLLNTKDLQMVPPVLPDARVICIGLNYRAHAAEGSYKDQELPPHPTLFARWTQSLTVAGVPAPVPANEDGLDWEGEIAAYIGRPLVDVDAETARQAVLGYSTFNDLTSRIAQKLTSQWILGKNGDNSGPLGPLVTADEVGDLRDGLRVQTRVNGTTVQDGNTKNMIYDLGETLSLISQTFTLRPGDIICTGTPEGVGYARNPQWLLQPGDVVEVEVDKLGVLTTPIVANDYRLEARK
ncbi:fumarylacetoacetate hydrolase family protein [Arthrobacter sp. ISL-85]|uniref:fumarylacetoacetate hydrolase family protein n=1 Tax=Arthrobacter sp. ISL-85 TaxID=2819115 RepID=UPI001BE76D20|nr:fumarylacetoacetate hydrolase family protein [Arthrobacter sp. ISL-85]MBT2565894.1 fumarylacetoacetate hydrolase family protein [Arthrobacter sp. ISL-85]